MRKRVFTPQPGLAIKTYDELSRYIKAFGAGHLNLLIVLGDPGLAKSQTVRQTLGSNACWIEGNASAFGMYRALWENRNRLVVLDDVDTLYADRSAVRLLKCLCQTDEEKRLAWHTASTVMDRDGIPRKFTTRSRVVIIANEWKTLDRNVAAIQDRGHVIRFEPSTDEVHRRVAEWFDDQEILQWFGDHLHLVHPPSMRHYVRAAELKRAGLEWETVLMSNTFPKKALLVARLKADGKFSNEKERVRAFVQTGAGCRATYFNHAKKLRRHAGAEYKTA